MPPSTLQARIKAFEALGMGASKQVLDTILSRDLKDWVIDDGPLRSNSPAPIFNGYSPKPFEPAPLISFEGSPPKPSKAPPLPPRQSSYNSLRSVSAPATSPTTLTSTSPSSNMLMLPDADHSYPPNLSGDKLSDSIRRAQGHAQASSVSSFHSVSLSSDSGDPTALALSPLHAFSMEREWTVASTEDGESLDESFENVSAPSSFLPPITLPPRPPKPPALATNTSSLASRGSSPSSISSPILALTPSGSSSAPSSPARAVRTSVQSTTTTTTTSASDRCSLFSTNSRTSFSSRTSVSPSKSSKPSAGRNSLPVRGTTRSSSRTYARNTAETASAARPAKRQNAGWRGLSMDLDQTVQQSVAAASIWVQSGLEPQRLRDIWNECDPEGLGSLDRDGIDEELRRAQLLGRAGPGTGSSSGASGRTPRRAPSRPILR
ncbi:hypothetical protein EI94DRAFT_1733095 [Lactarius quietus]|nr:hypothetical protein EI94DRAFT_1733095 [Lactarius quietus]